jgi:hypothetical protein
MEYILTVLGSLASVGSIPLAIVSLFEKGVVA